MIYLSKVKMILALLLVGLILPMADAAPRELIKFSIGAYILPDKTLEMELDVVAPRSPNSYPAILYLTGLSGLLPSKFQASLLDSIAEEGFIVLTVDHH
jgi:predicted alpha/beta-fold hydrolase